jgi:hypothetical protein
MATCIKAMTQLGSQVFRQEHKLLLVALKSMVGFCRSIWSIILSLKQKTHTSEKKWQPMKGYWKTWSRS